MEQLYFDNVYKHSYKNKEEILNSKVCGCFYCGSIFSATEISDWVMDNPPTAQCPHCCIDSVIGDASGIDVTEKLLNELHKRYFQ